LMERYLSAAGKVSRLAVGDPKIPVSYQTYPVSHGLNQTDRMSEAMPLGSRGGTAIRHRFPVDAEYEISVALQRGKADEFLGMGQERKLDLRLDDQRLGLFTIAASKGGGAVGAGYAPVGVGTDPDAHLKVRLPVKAGTRDLVATFLKDSVVSEDILPKRYRDGNDKDFFEGVGSISISGPFDVHGPGVTPSRDKIFICRPATPEEEINKIVTTLEHSAVEHGGKVEKTEKWGTRRLAYRVSKHREGFFVYMVLRSAQSDIIKELERRLKVSDAVIKYQTVRLDEDLKRQQKLVRHRERRASRRPRKPAATPAPQQQVPPAAEQTAAS